MPHIDCLVLHGVNPNLKKKSQITKNDNNKMYNNIYNFVNNKLC